MGLQQLPLIEPVPIDDDFCSGLAAIEDLGTHGRFVLYVDQTIYEANNQQARVVRRKIVMSWEDALCAAQMVLAFIAARAVRLAGERVLRLVVKPKPHEDTGSAIVSS